MKTVQFIEVTPEQLQNEILKGVKKELSELKKEYQPKEPTKYLTRNEVAKMLSVDLSTVHNWTKKGILKSVGIGSRVYYKRQEVENALVELQK